MSPPVIIFNGRLLPSSETFVKAQAEGLQKFTPYYAGARLVKGLPVPSDRTLVINSGDWTGSIAEVLFKQTGFAPRFYKKLQDLQPSLIHAHFGVCGALALPIVRALQIPLIVTFHGLDATMSDEYARRDSLSTRVYLQRRELLKCETTLFVAVSQFIKAALIKQGFPPEKILVHYIGIDTSVFRPEPDKPRTPTVLFVGRLTEKKGCQYLIEAMSRVQSTAPHVELVVIGDGPLRSSLEGTAEKLLKNYRFLGVQPPEVVRSWMNQAKVFCVPSIVAQSGDTEGFGMVFAEAQAMGLPVVSFATGGISEAVIHGKTGFLASEKDSQGLASYILQLIHHSELWKAFSLDGQEHIRSNFDLHRQIQVLEGIYLTAIENREKHKLY